MHSFFLCNTCLIFWIWACYYLPTSLCASCRGRLSHSIRDHPCSPPTWPARKPLQGDMYGNPGATEFCVCLLQHHTRTHTGAHIKRSITNITLRYSPCLWKQLMTESQMVHTEAAHCCDGCDPASTLCTYWGRTAYSTIDHRVFVI